MPLQSLSLNQNPDNPEIRYLQYVPLNEGANSWEMPKQFMLTKEQFAQFQNAGLQPTFTRDPIYYSKGAFNPAVFKQDASNARDPRFTDANNPTFNKIAATFDQMPTQSNADLANNPQARQDWLDHAMGGSKNVLTPSSEAQKNVEALKQAQNGSVSTAGLQNQKDTYSNMPVGIQLRPGLNEEQKQSIINLVSNKPKNQWTTEDKKNYDFATKLKLGQTGETVWTTQKFPIQQNEKILLGASSASMTPPSGVSGGAPTAESGSAESSGVSPSPKEQMEKIKQGLRDAGVSEDMLGLLSDNQLLSFGMMMDVMKKNAEANKTIVPKDFSQSEMDAFLEDAKKDVDPYFQQQFDMAKRDLLQNVSLLTGEVQTMEETNAAQMQAQNDQLAQAMAEQGLAQSGLRRQAEERLKQQQQGVVSSQRRKVGQDIYNLGSSFERTYGSKGLAGFGGIPQISGIGYTPQGGILGTQGAEQKQAEIQRQQQLMEEKLRTQYRQLNPGAI